MTTKIIAYTLIGLFLGPVASLLITPIFCLLRKIFFVPFIRKRLIEKAKQRGHVVEAHLQKSHNIMDHSGSVALPTMRDMGTYTYQVNGKEYTYRHITANGLHDTLILFYIKNPRKATVGGDLGNWESPWFKYYMIISLLVAIATAVVGMTMG